MIDAAPIIEGADPVPYSGGFAAVAERRPRAGDDAAAGLLRSTGRFLWPVQSPQAAVVATCTGAPLFVAPDSVPPQNGLYETGPIRPAVTVTTTVACSLMSHLDESKWEQAARAQHARVFPRKLGQLVTDPTMVHTDQDGNVSQSLTGSATRNVADDFGAVTSTGFDGTSEALLKLGVYARTVAARSDLGVFWFPAGLSNMAVKHLNMVAGGLPTVGVDRVPLIDEPAYSPLAIGAGAPAGTFRVAWTPQPSLRLGPVTVTRPDPLVATNDAQLTVSQAAIWDWPEVAPGVDVAAIDAPPLGTWT